MADESKQQLSSEQLSQVAGGYVVGGNTGLEGPEPDFGDDCSGEDFPKGVLPPHVDDSDFPDPAGDTTI